MTSPLGEGEVWMAVTDCDMGEGGGDNVDVALPLFWY